MIENLLETMLKEASCSHEEELLKVNQYDLLYKNLIKEIEKHVSKKEFIDIEEQLTDILNFRSEFMYKKGFKDGFKIKQYLD